MTLVDVECDGIVYPSTENFYYKVQDCYEIMLNVSECVDYLIEIKEKTNEVCKSLNSGDFKIVKCNDSKNVEIQFLKTGYETVVQLGHIKSGGVKDPYVPSVCGVGVDRYKVLLSLPPSIIKLSWENF